MSDYTNAAQANATQATARKFTCVSKMPVRTAKAGDTVEKARAKVTAQLLANKQYLLGGEQAKQKPVMVYKLVAQLYYVGIKYANKYLEGVFVTEDGFGNVVECGSVQECLEALDVAVERVNAGLCDAALKAAIAANVAMHNKRKAKA